VEFQIRLVKDALRRTQPPLVTVEALWLSRSSLELRGSAARLIRDNDSLGSCGGTTATRNCGPWVIYFTTV
jgi:hypothetical protein